MQIQMQAFCKKRGSLRQFITRDLHLVDHEKLYVTQFKAFDRPSGWAKLKARGVRGVINIKWDGSLKMLTARAIAEKGNYPHELLGIFVAYLVENYRKQITGINIQLG